MRSTCAWVFLAAAAATRALKLHTPTKWNVEHVNLLTWDFDADEDSTDPEQFSAQLRHPFFINGALAILGFARTVDGGALVYLPGLPTSHLYRVEAVAVQDTNKVFSTTKNFTIVTDGSPAPSFTLSFASPAQDNSPTPTPASNASQPSSGATTSTIPSTDASKTSGAANVHTPTPSLSFNAASSVRIPTTVMTLLVIVIALAL
ncbi:hypothetical protein EXIGLDRAFT_760045 [Exidia glandulosa HHB12029]|uniref:Uncharacterized protein n=1 Tax=Exidia glandulosa HHB12029 TaxID=1314781 RepID=A0A165PHU6_EXIGL|nr:hypothetical protein EXIGLDRAFT_760045 [Exidia glandulosa HHB12029]